MNFKILLLVVQWASSVQDPKISNLPKPVWKHRRRVFKPNLRRTRQIHGIHGRRGRPQHQPKLTLPLYRTADNSTTEKFDPDKVEKPGRWVRRLSQNSPNVLRTTRNIRPKTGVGVKSNIRRNPAARKLRNIGSRSRMTRQLQEINRGQGFLGPKVDCSSVKCPRLDNCVRKSFKPGDCCPKCLQEGCICEKGPLLNDCMANGYKQGKAIKFDAVEFKSFLRKKAMFL